MRGERLYRESEDRKSMQGGGGGRGIECRKVEGRKRMQGTEGRERMQGEEGKEHGVART